MRKSLLTLTFGALAVAAPAEAGDLTLGPTNLVSGASPFADGCGGPGEASPGSVVYQNAEVETHIAVNPTNGDNIVAFWQQDRWSDGGAHANRAAYTTNGGTSWAFSAPAFSRCAGGTGQTGGYERATDPWLSFSPNGRLHAISLVFDNSTARNAVVAAFSINGGASWSPPRVLRFDNPRAVGNNFNDKETLTADPLNSNFVYATWQRIVSPSEVASAKGFENAASFFSAAWFARSTNGGVSWEPAREIYRERGRFTQTIGNIVDVLPDGTLINGFNLIRAISNRHATRGFNVALIRSPDKGVTWTREIIVNRLLSDEVTDPEDPDQDVRTGDILPIWAVDRSGTATDGNIYVVWMDTRFNDPDHNDILLSRSENGGLSWSAPVEVDKTPDGVDAFTPYVDVDDQGRVAVTYYDFRNDEPGDDPLSTDLWITHSHDGGVTFPTEERLTPPTSFDMRTAPDALGYFVGDYTGLAHYSDEAFHAGWVGANDGDLSNRTDVFHRRAQ